MPRSCPDVRRDHAASGWEHLQLLGRGRAALGYTLQLPMHLPNFRMLEAGPMVGRLAAVPLLIFSAPYLIMRNTLRGGPLERRRGEVVMVATVIAGLWSRRSTTTQ